MRGQSVYLQMEHAQNVLSGQPFAICAFVQLSLNEIPTFLPLHLPSISALLTRCINRLRVGFNVLVTSTFGVYVSVGTRF